MPRINYDPKDVDENVTIELPLSKSVANRWLILEAIFPDIILKSIYSEARDTQILREALSSESKDVNLHDAGTAMRFATAYFASKLGCEVVLRGTDRMHERPIGPLVKALRDLGAKVDYLDQEGFPPLRIEGKRLRGGEVYVPADMSSQFLTALMLIAPATNDGLVIHRTSKAVSQPYVNMTADVLRQAGVEVEDEGMRIHVHGKPMKPIQVPTEGDWSAAVAFYAWVAVSGKSVHLAGLSAESVQGDKVLQDLGSNLGVVSSWNSGILELEFKGVPEGDFNIDFLDHPDLAQSFILAAACQGRSGKATGLRTLRLKETDRVEAISEAIEKLGGHTTATGGALYWQIDQPIISDQLFRVFDDHRMAMALAPLAFHGAIQVDSLEAVQKSFPHFWLEMSKLGMTVQP